jgi:hypothetical protein
VTNFTALTYAALVAMRQTVYRPAWLATAVPLFAIVAALSALTWLIALQFAVQRARSKVDRAKTAFTPAFREVSGQSPARGWLEVSDQLPLFVIVVLVGVAIAVSAGAD